MELAAEPSAFWFGAYRNLNLLVWLRAATGTAVERIDRTNPARVAAHPEGISTVHVILESAGPPDTDARNRLNAMHARWGKTVGCAAVVIEQRGFAGVTMRSVVTGMTLLLPKHFRLRVFDSVEAAAPWLSENHARSTRVQLTPEQMLTVLLEARQRALGQGAAAT